MWSPWRDGGTQEPEVGEGDGARSNATNECQLGSWRLKCDLKRVATYYRVTAHRCTGAGRSTQAQRKDEGALPRVGSVGAERTRGAASTRPGGRGRRGRGSGQAQEDDGTGVLRRGAHIQTEKYARRDHEPTAAATTAKVWADRDEHGTGEAIERQHECRGGEMCATATIWRRVV